MVVTTHVVSLETTPLNQTNEETSTSNYRPSEVPLMPGTGRAVAALVGRALKTSR